MSRKSVAQNGKLQVGGHVFTIFGAHHNDILKSSVSVVLSSSEVQLNDKWTTPGNRGDSGSDPDSDYETDAEEDCSSFDGNNGTSLDSIVHVGEPPPSTANAGRASLIVRRSSWRRYRGILLAVLSSLIFAVSALLVKKLESYDPFNSALYKYQGALLPAIPLFLQKFYCSPKGARVVDAVWPVTERKKLSILALVILRSVLTCNALLLHYFSLKYLPIGDALTIASATPIFVAVLAKIFLGEKCGYSTIVASIFSMLGVIAIAKPPVLSPSDGVNSNLLIGSSLALASTLVSAVSFVVLRQIRKVHYSVTTLLFGVWGSLECLALVLLIPGLKIPTQSSELWLIIGLAGLTLVGQLAIILAMKMEQAGPVALVRTLDTLFGYFFQLTVTGTLPDLWSVTGAVVIVLSVSFVGLRKWVKSHPKTHAVRKRLHFLTF